MFIIEENEKNKELYYKVSKIIPNNFMHERFYVENGTVYFTGSGSDIEDSMTSKEKLKFEEDMKSIWDGLEELSNKKKSKEDKEPTLTGEYAEQLQEDKEIKTYKLSDFDIFYHLRLLAQQFIENKATKTFIKEYELKDGVRIKTIFTRGKKDLVENREPLFLNEQIKAPKTTLKWEGQL